MIEIINIIKRIKSLKNILFSILLGSKYKIKVLRKKGAIIGNNVNYLTIYLPDYNESSLLTIGNYVTISNNVMFIFHDGAIGIINRHPYFLKRNIHVYKIGSICIGNNSFLGAGSIILPNIKIGNFSIIAAGSVVTKNIPSNQVWAGCPARFIKTTEQYIEEVIKDNNYKISKEEIDNIIREN